MRLNGRGTNGADGTEVFVGMIAAPRSYAFGTKIEIPGLGVGAVHDRGGAIIKRTNYDRIDIWMGKGDEGLNRALNWGMVKVTGKVFFEKKVSTNLTFAHISSSLPITLKKAKKIVRKKSFKLGNKDKSIINIKNNLSQLGYFKNKINDIFDEDLKNAIINFQIDQKIIKSARSYGAGFIGSKTLKILKQALANKPTVKVAELKKPLNWGNDSKIKKTKKVQVLLSNLKYYHGPINGTSSSELTDSIFQFQKDNKILISKNDPGAGVFGPKTSAKVDEIIKKQKNYLAAFPVSKSSIIEGSVSKSKKLAYSNTKINFPAIKHTTLNEKTTLQAKTETNNTIASNSVNNYKQSKSQILKGN